MRSPQPLRMLEPLGAPPAPRPRRRRSPPTSARSPPRPTHSRSATARPRPPTHAPPPSPHPPATPASTGPAPPPACTRPQGTTPRPRARPRSHRSSARPGSRAAHPTTRPAGTTPPRPRTTRAARTRSAPTRPRPRPTSPRARRPPATREPRRTPPRTPGSARQLATHAEPLRTLAGEQERQLAAARLAAEHGRVVPVLGERRQPGQRGVAVRGDDHRTVVGTARPTASEYAVSSGPSGPESRVDSRSRGLVPQRARACGRTAAAARRPRSPPAPPPPPRPAAPARGSRGAFVPLMPNDDTAGPARAVRPRPAGPLGQQLDRPGRPVHVRRRRVHVQRARQHRRAASPAPS